MAKQPDREGGVDQRALRQARKQIEQQERSAESVDRIVSLLGSRELFPWVVDIQETEAWGDEDRSGIDLICKLNDELAELTGLSVLNIQVKSSPQGIAHFLKEGHVKNGNSGKSWWERGLIVLDASQEDGFLVADFMIQLINLMGIWPCLDEKDKTRADLLFETEDFLSFVDPRLSRIIGQHQEDVMQARAAMLRWVVSARPGFKKSV